MPLPSLADLAAKLAKIPPDELARQHRLLTDGAGLRSMLTGLVYALAAFFVALPVVLFCAAVDFASERLSLHWMKGLDAARAPRRYLATIAVSMLSQLA